jgi:hypothetical protein
VLLLQATQPTVMPDIPNWLITGGAGAIGPLLVWWVLRTLIPSLIDTHKEQQSKAQETYRQSLGEILNDSKANRDAFRSATDTFESEVQSQRDAEEKRRAELQAELKEAQRATIDLLRSRQREAANEPAQPR